MTGGASLDVDSIEFAYGNVQVLFGVSLHVEPGESLALLGTNGAGKSTLLRVIAGLERPTAGTVRLDGEDLAGLSAERRVARGVGLAPGGQGVFPDLTVDENLEIGAYALRHRSRADWRAARTSALEAFPRLADRSGSRAKDLSGGEQQQLAIARTLLLAPRVLCIDELSLGLAPIVVESLLNVLDAVRRRGTTVLLVEQSLNIAAAVCERAVFLEKGAVRFEGPTAQLLDGDDIARAVFFGGAATR